MRIVLDTNVFVSGVFFGGPPGRILDAWAAGRVLPVLSPEILAEYRRVGEVLAAARPGVDLEPFITMLATHADLVQAPPLLQPVCSDPDDDKFIACALAADVPIVVSGDAALLRVDGHEGLRILRPREFVDRVLPGE